MLFNPDVLQLRQFSTLFHYSSQAERATIEALASFGGAGLDSVLEPTETFRDKLEKDKQKLKVRRV